MTKMKAGDANHAHQAACAAFTRWGCRSKSRPRRNSAQLCIAASMPGSRHRAGWHAATWLTVPLRGTQSAKNQVPWP